MTIEKRSLFTTKCERWEMMLAEIEKATAFQSRNFTLSDCLYVMDSLIEAVRERKNNVKSDLYGCRLESKNTSLH